VHAWLNKEWTIHIRSQSSFPMVLVKNLCSHYISTHPRCPCLLRGSYFHDSGDDDEGVIFEEDEDDDENDGYLFVGQCAYLFFFIMIPRLI
jgi:hypothetical protein